MSPTGILYKITVFLLAILLVIGGWMLARSGFDSIQNIRQIERLPTTSLAAALPGEVKLNAKVAPFEHLLKSEHFKTNSVYYHYRYEEEETDSDGNTYWATKYQRIESVNFLLQDNTGQIRVNVKNRANDQLEFSMPVSQQITRGGTRYTEWRIEPGDQIFVLGMLKSNALKPGTLAQNAPAAEIGFIEPGQYFPLISKFGEDEEKSDLGISVILMVCGGISLIALASFCITTGLSIHRIIAFLFVLSLFVFVPLVHLGTSMLHHDIVSGQAKLQAHKSIALNTINQEISSTHQAINNFAELNQSLQSIGHQLPQQSTQKIADIHLNLVYAEQRYLKQLQSFPNNLIAWFYDVSGQNIIETLSIEQQQRLEKRLAGFEQATTRGKLPLIVISAGLILSALLSWLGFRLIRLKRHIENIPTSKTSGLVFGLSEIKGRVTKILDDDPLRSPLTNSRCYWYRYIVQEKRQRGKETEWVTIEDRQEHRPFFCKDSHGEIKVAPHNAEIISKHTSSERRGNRRYTEKTIKLSDKVYVLGYAKIDRDVGDKLVIRGAKKERPFLITNLSEQEVMLRKAFGGMFSLTMAFSALMFASLFYLGTLGSFSPADYLAAAFIAPIYMSLLILVLHYNDLIFLKQRAARNLSNIDVSMQKRADLIPNLEKVIKKFSTHEQDLLKQLTRLRAKTHIKDRDLNQLGEQIENEQQALTKILALAEDYPELKAHKLNVNLMNKLVDLENEVALMREGYNDAVTYYNTRIASIPDVFFARAFGFQSMDLFHFEARKFSRVEIQWKD